MKRNKKMRVVDFFSGAGGFSEGFRQEGFEIVMGIDKWQPAIDTHNLNHCLNDSAKDVLDFWNEDSLDTKEINNIPNTEFIIGSPSCVSFSMSNNAGKADKTLGILLIEAYLRVIAVKKHQPNSILMGWYMENVPKSREHLKRKYTFRDLKLEKWAKYVNKNPESIALHIKGDVFDAGDYGAPQERKRFIVGEWVETGEFIPPQKTHSNHIKSSEIRDKMPKPNAATRNEIWKDPNYSFLTLKTEEITDHFYDTGLYEIEWEKAEHLKTNHPFMGRMSFPENEDRTCRTITATRSAITREAIIYKSEYRRRGNGEYRLPTIREIASLMGFPYCYQFVGSEGIKWRQIGNSVCPQMSAALAKALRKKMGLSEIEAKKIDFSSLRNNHSKVNNLNTFAEKDFKNPKKRRVNARFRRHPIKMANMTVDLMNYHPQKNDEIGKKWYISVFFGTGYDHAVKVLEEKDLKKIEEILRNSSSDFPSFKTFTKNLKKNKYSFKELQKIYEEDSLLENKNNPLKIVKSLARTIQNHGVLNKYIEIDELFPRKNIPLAQLMAMYGLSTLFSQKYPL